jgi:hypothetical protein
LIDGRQTSPPSPQPQAPANDPGIYFGTSSDNLRPPSLAVPPASFVQPQQQHQYEQQQSSEQQPQQQQQQQQQQPPENTISFTAGASMAVSADENLVHAALARERLRPGQAEDASSRADDLRALQEREFPSSGKASSSTPSPEEEAWLLRLHETVSRQRPQLFQPLSQPLPTSQPVHQFSAQSLLDASQLGSDDGAPRPSPYSAPTDGDGQQQRLRILGKNCYSLSAGGRWQFVGPTASERCKGAIPHRDEAADRKTRPQAPAQAQAQGENVPLWRRLRPSYIIGQLVQRG